MIVTMNFCLYTELLSLRVYSVIVVFSWKRIFLVHGISKYKSVPHPLAEMARLTQPH